MLPLCSSNPAVRTKVMRNWNMLHFFKILPNNALAHRWKLRYRSFPTGEEQRYTGLIWPFFKTGTRNKRIGKFFIDQIG
jgi:hypothetical protein